MSLLQKELNVAAAAADEVLPSIETGRFAGLSGGAAFRQSGEADLREFISYIAHPDLQGSSFVSSILMHSGCWKAPRPTEFSRSTAGGLSTRPRSRWPRPNRWWRARTPAGCGRHGCGTSRAGW